MAMRLFLQMGSQGIKNRFRHIGNLHQFSASSVGAPGSLCDDDDIAMRSGLTFTGFSAKDIKSRGTIARFFQNIGFIRPSDGSSEIFVKLKDISVEGAGVPSGNRLLLLHFALMAASIIWLLQLKIIG